MQNPIRIAVSGPAGQIGYAALFRIASGGLFGERPVALQLLERDNPTSQSALKGVMMELADSAFPLLAEMTATTDPKQAFRDADIVFLFGARPRGPGMERADLLEANARIFYEHGRALDEVASRDVKVLVVGNPCNTNAWIAMKSAPSLSSKCFSALLRLDQNRARSMLAEKTGRPVREVHQIAVWGNHSPTMYPDIAHATVGPDRATDLVSEDWIRREFVPTVARRGTAVLQARGASSAASAASAAIDHMRDWVRGSVGEWVTMGVPSDGSYGIPEGLVFGFPCICRGGEYEIIQGIGMDDSTRAALERTKLELEGERDAVRSLFGL